MNRKCIVTGATGYIGSHVVKHFLSHGWSVSVVMRPTSDTKWIKDVINEIHLFRFDGDVVKLYNFFKDSQAEFVIHLAAAVIGAPSISQISSVIRSNIEFGTQILASMKEAGIRKFINTGTYWQNYRSSEYDPVDLYAATKEAFEKILKFYVEAYGFRTITLRLFDVYGEDDSRPKLWNLIRDHAITGQPLDLSGGEQNIDLVHVSDVCRAYESACNLLQDDHDVADEVYGVSSGVRKPLKEVVALYLKKLNIDPTLNWGGRPYRSREVMCPAEYKILPGWKPEIDLETGFDMMAASFRTIK